MLWVSYPNYKRVNINFTFLLVLLISQHFIVLYFLTKDIHHPKLLGKSQNSNLLKLQVQIWRVLLILIKKSVKTHTHKTFTHTNNFLLPP